MFVWQAVPYCVAIFQRHNMQQSAVSYVSVPDAYLETHDVGFPSPDIKFYLLAIGLPISSLCE